MIAQDKIKLVKHVTKAPLSELDEDSLLHERLANSVKLQDDACANENAARSKNTTTMIKGSGCKGGYIADLERGLRPPDPDKATTTRTNGDGNAQGEDVVVKSANWLSDSELVFSLTNQVGGLVRALRIFEELGIGIKHVESRPSKRRNSEFEIFVDIDCSDQAKMKKLVHHLRHEVNCLTKQEFERSSSINMNQKKPPGASQLVRQPSLSLGQTNNNATLSTTTMTTANGFGEQDQYNELYSGHKMNGPRDEGDEGDEGAGTSSNNNASNKALALMVQPSIDYGEYP